MKLAAIIGLITLALFAISCTPPQGEAEGIESTPISDPTPIPTEIPDLPEPEEKQEPAPETDPQQPATDQQEDADQEPAPEPDPQQPDSDQGEAPSENEGPVGQEIELEDVENPPGTNIFCSQSMGCFFTPLDSEDLEILDPDEEYFEPDEIEDTSFERVVCIRGDSCYFTDLTEEDIEILDQDILFTAHSDADLIGNWRVTNHPTTFECFGVETELPATNQDGVIFEFDGNLVGGGLTDDEVELTFTKIWYGTYMSYLNIPADQGSIDFTYYMALQDDTNFTGFFTSSIRVDDTEVGDIRCDMNRNFDAARISP